jgi:transcriptional regulator with XRE-family HTH domain
VSRTSQHEVQARLGRVLRRERTRRKWTQEVAAERAAMNPRHYQKLEEGSVNVTIRTIARLANAFDLEVADLFRA